MKFNTKQFIGLLLGAMAMLQVNAASITLKDGRSFEGEIKSHNSETIVLDMNGIDITFPTTEVQSVDLSAVNKSEPENAAPEAKQVNTEIASEPAVDTSTVAKGSTLTVKISDGFNSRHHKTGQRFTAELESNLLSNGVVIAPKGSQVYGVLTEVKKAGRIAGAASLSFELTEISIDGNMHPIKTQVLSGEGENTAKATAGRTARAAAIGGLVDGSDGAKTGAKVGVGASLLSQGSDIAVAQGELIDFTLIAPFIAS